MSRARLAEKLRYLSPSEALRARSSSRIRYTRAVNTSATEPAALTQFPTIRPQANKGEQQTRVARVFAQHPIRTTVYDRFGLRSSSERR